MLKNKQLLSKIVVPKIESKSQLRDTIAIIDEGCYQRSLFLKLKANHNRPETLVRFAPVVIKDRCS